MTQPSHIKEAPEEVLSTMSRDGTRKWMYPTLSRGIWLNRRAIVGWALIAFFVILPLVPIKGKPAILLDIVHRQFTFFGTTLYATDTIVLMLFLLTTFFGIFFATALLGRAWCGWGCPQTVYLEFIYRPIERWIEGNENTRRKRDDRPMDFDGFLRKAAKYAIYVVISVGLAHTFVAFFVGWPTLSSWMTGPPSEHWGFFLMMGITTGLIMLDFAYFREQMCTIACPYARLQSVLLDRDSLIVSYDEQRGEPRGRAKRKAVKAKLDPSVVSAPLGDCVDCGACVRTCPVGIDIREGLQMECIGCTQCIDACDPIMLKLGREPGLIRYTSENALEKTNPRVVRPRTVIYGAIFGVFLTALCTVLALAAPADFNITRAKGAPFMKLPDGKVANRLVFRVQNRSQGPEQYAIRVHEPAGAEVRLVGRQNVSLKPGEIGRIEGWVVAEPGAFTKGAVAGDFHLVGQDGETKTNFTFNLLGPHRGFVKTQTGGSAP